MYGSITLREESNFVVKLLHLTDCILVVLAFRLLSIIYDVPWSQYYTKLSWAVFILSFITFYSFRLYRPWRGSLYYDEFIVIVKAWSVIIGAILSILFITKTSYSFSRKILLTWFSVTPFILLMVHFLSRYGLRLIRKRGFNLRNAIIIGARELGLGFAMHLEKMPWTGIRVLGFFDDETNKKDLKKLTYNYLGTVEKIEDYLINNVVDYIYIALHLGEEQRIQSIIGKARTLGAQVFLVPDHLSLRVFNAEYQSLGDLVLISFNPSNRVKRFFDIVFSSLILVLTFPLFLIIGIIIKIENNGPVFYQHKRITINGKTFKCLKFRTMCIDADKKLYEILKNNSSARKEWEKSFKLKNDPRITWMGKYLRRTSLDELPQFFNVLKGDMSVVGARPIVNKELKNFYKEKAGLYCSIKPGITGPWQVGKRNDSDDYSDRIYLDTAYILENSIWLDIKIIFKTVWSIIKGNGAY